MVKSIMNINAIRTIKEMTGDIWSEVDMGEWARPCAECGSFHLQFLETDREHGHQLKYVCYECGYKSNAIKRNPDGKTDRVHQKEWSKVIISRAGGKCEIPGCNEDATEAHHRTPYQLARKMGLSEYDIWAPYNGIALCTKHHREWHAESLRLETVYESKRKKRFK